uniref:Uncharacterized protein n=1 Tax=Caenorhabditis japonica TaxID=281687 RepID=A0A8R1IEE9_CAEJA
MDTYNSPEERERIVREKLSNDKISEYRKKVEEDVAKKCEEMEKENNEKIEQNLKKREDLIKNIKEKTREEEQLNREYEENLMKKKHEETKKKIVALEATFKNELETLKQKNKLLTMELEKQTNLQIKQMKFTNVGEIEKLRNILERADQETMLKRQNNYRELIEEGHRNTSGIQNLRAKTNEAIEKSDQELNKMNEENIKHFNTNITKLMKIQSKSNKRKTAEALNDLTKKMNNLVDSLVKQYIYVAVVPDQPSKNDIAKSLQNLDVFRNEAVILNEHMSTMHTKLGKIEDVNIQRKHKNCIQEIKSFLLDLQLCITHLSEKIKVIKFCHLWAVCLIEKKICRQMTLSPAKLPERQQVA